MCDCSLGISGWEQGGEVLDGVIGDAALVGRLDEHLFTPTNSCKCDGCIKCGCQALPGLTPLNWACGVCCHVESYSMLSWLMGARTLTTPLLNPDPKSTTCSLSGI